MKRYLHAMLVGILVSLGLFLMALHALSLTHRLPAPQFANSQCVDEKLRAMRLNPPIRPNLLVVGSSVAWRHFSGAAATAFDPAVRPYNAAFCHANVQQTHAATEWLVGRLPDVRHVVLIASPVDFQGCLAEPVSQFDVEDVDRYVFRREPAVISYFKYFDPGTLARNSMTVQEARTRQKIFDSVVMTPTGDGPSAPPWRGLHYGAIEPESACFRSLGSLAAWLAERNIRFDITMTPMHPEWQARFGGASYAREFQRRITASVQDTPARLQPSPTVEDERNFYDAMHLRWQASHAFTRSLMNEMNRDADS